MDSSNFTDRMTIIVISLFAAFFVGIIVFVIVRDSRRRALMRKLAEEFGWTISCKKNKQFFRNGVYSGFLISRNILSYAHNVMRGTLLVTRTDGSVENFEIQAGDFLNHSDVAHTRANARLESFVLIRLPATLDGNLLVRNNGYVGPDENRIQLQGISKILQDGIAVVSPDAAFARRVATRRFLEHVLGRPYFVQLSNRYLLIRCNRMTLDAWRASLAWAQVLLEIMLTGCRVQISSRSAHQE